MSTEHSITTNLDITESKGNDKRKVVYLSLDYDGCMDALFYENFINDSKFTSRNETDQARLDSKNWKIAHDNMLELLQKKTQDANSVIVMVGSNRQSRTGLATVSPGDDDSSEAKRTGRCFDNYKALCELKNSQNKDLTGDQTWVFNELLYHDIIHRNPKGTAMDNSDSLIPEEVIKQSIPAAYRNLFPKDEGSALKTLFLTEQLRIAGEEIMLGSEADFCFIDDNEEVIKQVYEHFRDQANKIPEGINFKVIKAEYPNFKLNIEEYQTIQHQVTPKTDNTAYLDSLKAQYILPAKNNKPKKPETGKVEEITQPELTQLSTKPHQSHSNGLFPAISNKEIAFISAGILAPTPIAVTVASAVNFMQDRSFQSFGDAFIDTIERPEIFSPCAAYVVLMLFAAKYYYDGKKQEKPTDCPHTDTRPETGVSNP